LSSISAKGFKKTTYKHIRQNNAQDFLHSSRVSAMIVLKSRSEMQSPTIEKDNSYQE
ncbi:9601_t:CDS:1, partial [Funneliformis caledonium]